MRLMRLVLEGINDPETLRDKTVVMDGPLGEVFTKALAVAYAKTPLDQNPNAGEAIVAVESQVNDSIMQEAVIRTLSKSDVTDTNKPGTTIYGVCKEKVGPQDIINVATKISALQENTQRDFDEQYILVIDATKPQQDTGETHTEIVDLNKAEQNNVATALETMAIAFGVKVTHSLEEALSLL